MTKTQFLHITWAVKYEIVRGDSFGYWRFRTEKVRNMQNCMIVSCNIGDTTKSDVVLAGNMRSVIRWLLKIVFRVRVLGDMSSLRGGGLVLANCDSTLDGILLGLFLPGEPIVVTTPEMRASFCVRFLSRYVHSLSLDPSHPFTVKTVVHHVKGGGIAIIFPAGKVTSTGGVMKVLDAAVVITGRCQPHVIPVRVHGTLYSRFSCVSGNWPKRLFPRVTLAIRRPLPELLSSGSGGRRRRQAQSVELQQAMQHLMSEPVHARDLFGALVEAANLHGHRTRIMEDARRQPETYGQVLRQTLALSRLLSKTSDANETVGILLPNLSTSLAAVIGLTGAGRVAAMLNYSGGAEAMRSACVAARVKTVVTARQFLERAGLQHLPKALPDAHWIYLEDLREAMTVGDKLWLLAYAVWWPTRALPAADPQQPAVVLFTSGSEDHPKGVVLSHAAMLVNMSQLQSVIDFGPNHKFFSALPLYHSFGLIACALMPLMTGTRLFLYVSPLHYRNIPDLVYQSDSTYIFGTSTFLGHYARNAHPFDFQSVRTVICGGEKLGKEVERLYRERFGLRVYEGYGATECGPAMSLNTPMAFREASVGRPLPGVECRLVPVPGLTVGQALHVRSPNLMTGYLRYDNPGVIVPPASECGQGWYSTGDVVQIDEDGFLFIIARTRRFAKIAGEMVSLDLIERIAARAAPGAQHAATLRQRAELGEETVLFTTDVTLDRMMLIRAAREMQAPEIAISRHIIRVEQLPLTGAGKVDYLTLRLHAEDFRL